jgi:hypothetical protein
MLVLHSQNSWGWGKGHSFYCLRLQHSRRGKQIAFSFAGTQLQLIARHGELAVSSDELHQRSTTWAHVYLCNNPVITAT